MENKFLVEMYPEATAQFFDLAAGTVEGRDKYGWAEIPKFFGSFYKPIGMEFEVEGCAIQDLGLLANNEGKYAGCNYWRCVKDGSLRNHGLEFVSVPVVGHGIDYALHELDKQILTRYPTRTNSIRTSIHVHVDVSKWKIREMWHLLPFYALFEEVFFSFHDWTRQANPYCYPITSLRPGSVGIFESLKYCALNLAPIERQMTIEFRHADFSLDMKKNRRWIQMVCKFMKFAEEHRDSLSDIVEQTVAMGTYEKLFRQVMGKTATLFEPSQVDQLMKANAFWAIAAKELA